MHQHPSHKILRDANSYWATNFGCVVAMIVNKPVAFDSVLKSTAYRKMKFHLNHYHDLDLENPYKFAM
ncbi:MAG: hypothetical protein ACD_29C00184G0001 [uncultured bacterium]|nr:MAG: hypothetical protein ACD_29C00184G0001 [uncultured bacterium]